MEWNLIRYNFGSAAESLTTKNWTLALVFHRFLVILISNYSIIFWVTSRMVYHLDSVIIVLTS